MMDILPLEVTTLEQAQVVARIRNEVRQFMTRDQSHISPAQQEKWWQNRNPSALRLFLYFKPNSTVPMGYSLLTVDSRGIWWGTLALLPEYQGQGYGTLIYKHLVSLVSVLHIEIYSHNVASMNAAVHAGFKIKHIGDTTVVFFAERKY